MSRRPRGRRGRRLAIVAGWSAFVLVILSCATWYADGGRWVRVETPSMGQVAPVGSLIWLRPADFATLRKGDLITFRPPGSETTFSHNVERRYPDGTISTKGVLSPSDPWRLESKDIVGRAVMVWKGAGWLALMAPMLLVGALVIGGVRRLLRPSARAPMTLLLGAALVALAVSWYDPLVGAQQLAFTPNADGSATGTFVGTGLLPVELAADGGDTVRIGAGEVGTVRAVSPSDSAARVHRLEVAIAPVFAWWWWLAIVVGCFAPASVSAVRSRRRARCDRPAAAEPDLAAVPAETGTVAGAPVLDALVPADEPRPQPAPRPADAADPAVRRAADAGAQVRTDTWRLTGVPASSGGEQADGGA
ncbi:hypothetical protein E8D34_16950 [Nocardioides sp. GY 10113]|uniref:S24/S26 family peptidase n=1 Tax=Nocardioides sp. GY 10113 TaxID=2569761 RepID=UPI0010A7D09F|nr:S24/S26 family peptidase [Nocardioides sp. GY 10113]TIC82505.1 hypothetical protein E8D34_16950 [Nocardioides sp. GY 10113]